MSQQYSHQGKVAVAAPLSPFSRYTLYIIHCVAKSGRRSWSRSFHAKATEKLRSARDYYNYVPRLFLSSIPHFFSLLFFPQSIQYAALIFFFAAGDEVPGIFERFHEDQYLSGAILRGEASIEIARAGVVNVRRSAFVSRMKYLLFSLALSLSLSRSDNNEGTKNWRAGAIFNLHFVF